MRLSIKAFRASKFERSTQHVKYRSSPTSHAESWRPSNPHRYPMCATVAIGTQIETRIDRPIASQCAPPWPSEPRPNAESSNQSLPDVRHRGDRNPDRNQNRSRNRCPTCATVAMGTQFGTRIERQIACQLEPKIDTEIDPNRCPTCATVVMGTQFETRIERQIACQLEPKIDTEIDPKSMQNRPPKGQNDSQIWPWGAQTTQEGPRRVSKSLLGRSWGSL